MAAREEDRAMDEQPLMAAPSEVKSTVPDGLGDPAGEIVAVSVTELPEVEGFRLEATVVAVAGRTTCVNVPKLPS